MRAMATAATGMMAQQTNVDVIANNIANANTTGFKSMRAAFQDLVYQSQIREGALINEAGTSRPVGVDIGMGVQTAGVIRLNTQGSLLMTENQLDVAIDGKGFFNVNMPDGSTAYTRDGNFQLSAEGTIVTKQGYEIDPGLTIPENTTSVSISEQGIVSAYVENDPTPVELGQLTMSTFINEAGMKAEGDNLLYETVASGEAVAGVPGDPGFGMVRQGYLEQSNVNIIQQITDLITAQRAYEMNSKAIETADQMLSSANQIR